MAGKGALWQAAAAAIAVGVAVAASRRYGMDKDAALGVLRGLSERLGPWAVPAYVAAHTVTLALCLPYAVFFEAGAPVLFGFLPAVGCVFSAKVLGASLSFWIGRAIFRSSRSAMEWVHRNKYFHLLVRGVERDGWKFVLLARFSPLPSYVINYTLAATEVNFLVDFLLPTVIGSLPMILQNTSLGSLAGAAVASTNGLKKSHLSSYLFPILGIVSSILISLRVKRYSSKLSVAAELRSSSSTKNSEEDCNNVNGASDKPHEVLKRRH